MISLLPNRAEKPRTNGITMVMDKGLGLRQAQDLAETCGHLIDFMKLGFGTSLVCKLVKEKVRFYKDHNMFVCVGGTLFEAFYVRNKLDEFIHYINDLGCNAVEISDGSIAIDESEKCKLIERFSKDFVVVSEVGAKDEEVMIHADTWIKCMRDELSAGSSFVIGEARESGTVGIYEKNGSADDQLINKILNSVPGEKIIWEAPLKSQQAWFIRLLGSNVNLGNISPTEVAALETLRLGLRGDTFFEFLPGELKKYKLHKKTHPRSLTK